MTGLSALISVHPGYVARIVSGEKRFEYRRVMPRRDITHLALYSTSPVQKITALVEVKGRLDETLESVWSKTSSKSGISEQLFRTYFSGRSKASAFVLGEVSKLKSPVPLAELSSLYKPPRSFYYLDKAVTQRLLALR